MTTAIFFNLLVNSAFSMACGLLLVGFFIWLFRVESGPSKLFLLSLPFVKIIYDSIRGLPHDSILLAGLDPFSLPPKHQLLQIGGGMSYWGPRFSLAFSVENTDGQKFAASIGDYLMIWLQRTFGGSVPFLLLCVVLAISAFFLVRRIFSAIQFELRRRNDSQITLMLHKQRIDFRSVQIYVSKSFSGTPFTGGIFKPYICLPDDAFQKLSSEEVVAVIAHELGHIRQFDLAGTIAVQLLGDIFWFVPGYRWLSRRIDRLREIVADQWAVRSGIAPSLLASVLVKLKDIPETPDRFILYSAFYRERSLLKERVDKLLGSRVEKRSRFGWQNIWIRSVLCVWIFMAVMTGILGGNQY